MEKSLTKTTQISQLPAKNTLPDPAQQAPDSKKPMSIQKNQNCLSNILQLSEQYEGQGQGKTIILQSMKKEKKFDVKMDKIDEYPDDGKQNQSILSCFTQSIHKGLNCLLFTYRTFYHKMASENVNVEESQISEILSKLRKRRQRKISLLPEYFIADTRRQKRTLVLDLQETILTTTFKKPSKYDFQIKVEVNNKQICFYVIKRFGLDSFLFQMSQYYQIVVFSSAKMCYVQKIIQKIDPKKYISHVLGRQHCIVINKTYYIKPIKDLGRDPKSVLMVDSHPISASLNPQNLYKIQVFKGSSKDRKLVKLRYFLKYLHQDKTIKEIIPVQKLRKQFEQKQIDIWEQKQDQSKSRLCLKKQNREYEQLVPKNETEIQSYGSN